MSEIKDKYVDIHWVAEFTGFCESMIYQLADPDRTPKDRLIPSYKPTPTKGKKAAIRFKISEVEKWMQRSKQQAS